MVKDNDNTPVKYRSAGACISAGYRLFADNFRRIFRSTWLVAAVYALVVGLFYHFMLAEIPRLLVSLGTGRAGAVPLSVGLAYRVGNILVIAVALMLAAAGFSLLRKHRAEGEIPYPAKWLNVPKGAWKHLLKTALMGFGVMVAACLVVALFIALLAVVSHTGAHSLMLMLLTMLLFLVVYLLMLPLVHPFTMYVTTDEPKLLATVKREYPRAFRRWGLCFSVVFVTSLVTMMAALLTTLPSYVLLFANFLSARGTVMGDPAGMPGYMGWMSVVVFSLAGFIQAYVSLSALFPMYYLSGSIEAFEKEKSGSLKAFEA